MSPFRSQCERPTWRLVKYKIADIVNLACISPQNGHLIIANSQLVRAWLRFAAAL